MVSSPAGVGEVMHKALTAGISCIGVPFLRASTTTAVVGWPHPQMSSQRHVPHEFAVAAPVTNLQCSVFQQYPALQLLLDPVQWPPIGHRAHMLAAVQKTPINTTRPSRGDSLNTTAELPGLGSSPRNDSKVHSKVPILKQKGLEKEESLSIDSLASAMTGSSSLTAGTSGAEKKRAKRSRRHSAQSSQIAELRHRLRAQKLLSLKTELQHVQHSALRAWAAECKRARAAVAHKNELDTVTSHMEADHRKLAERLESASTKFGLRISQLESVVQSSQKELQEKRLLALSPCGRRWRLQRVALQLWASACAQRKGSGISQELRAPTKKRRSRVPSSAVVPPLPSITEVAESSSGGERQIDLVSTPPGLDVSKGLDTCGCDQTWGCRHQQMYSKEVLLLHREMAKQIARGPPGLSLGTAGEFTGEQRDAYQFKVVPRH